LNQWDFKKNRSEFVALWPDMAVDCIDTTTYRLLPTIGNNSNREVTAYEVTLGDRCVGKIGWLGKEQNPELDSVPNVRSDYISCALDCRAGIMLRRGSPATRTLPFPAGAELPGPNSVIRCEINRHCWFVDGRLVATSSAADGDNSLVIKVDLGNLNSKLVPYMDIAGKAQITKIELSID
jgi:hypothetical protein